jgi:hypothetical protein
VQRAREGRRMRAEGGRPERQAQGRGERRRQSVRGADTADDDRAAPSRRTSPAMQTLREVLTAALRQRVLQRTARDQRSPTHLVGHICEHCLDAPAVLVQPTPWGGEMGVCGACHQAPLAGDEAPQAG